ncbi:MAG: hypothetical protein CME66_01510 [Halobacteriovoraceae bacterium]|jgi:chromosome segregation ATPase|nr:hypothetical protein [Halobacteriovoraceae bacterium]|tara:strand:- start:419 stop:1819 length:1401 start_codon:yes stop_codon:yes gene_type:complete
MKIFAQSIMASLVMIITHSSFANFNDPELAEVYRQRHKNMDICAEVKEDLLAAQTRFESFHSKVESANKAIRNQRQVLNAKRQELHSTEQHLNETRSQLNSLKNKKSNKDKIIAKANQDLQEVQQAWPATNNEYNKKKRREEKKCDRGWGFGNLTSSCRDAKRELSRIKKKRNALIDKKKQAQASLNEMAQIDQKIARAKRAREAAKNNYDSARTGESVAQMERELRQLIARRDNNNQGYQEVEARYGRLQVRTEKCIKMQFEGRKNKAFKESLITFAQDNGAGCDQAMAVMASARGQAQKAGVNEAYQMVCESDLLVREVIVEVESESNHTQCHNNQDDSSAHNGYQTEFIYEEITTNSSPSQTYPSHLRQGRSPVELKTISKVGAKQIKLDIDKIDMEANYDYIQILDGEGNIIADKLTNPSRGNPIKDYSTGWIDGDSLTIMIYTDGLTERTGFHVSGFEVRY